MHTIQICIYDVQIYGSENVEAIIIINVTNIELSFRHELGLCRSAYQPTDRPTNCSGVSSILNGAIILVNRQCSISM